MALPIRSKNKYIASPIRSVQRTPPLVAQVERRDVRLLTFDELIGGCREPLLAPYLYLTGQALQARGDQQQPPSDLRVARLARELPHFGGPLQVFPHPQLFVEHCKAPTNISPGRRTRYRARFPADFKILFTVAWVPKRSRNPRTFVVNDVFQH